jgi:hypothetical protein
MQSDSDFLDPDAKFCSGITDSPELAILWGWLQAIPAIEDTNVSEANVVQLVLFDTEIVSCELELWL